MTEDQRAFWSAIVQLIPVLALALVIEARAPRRRLWHLVALYVAAALAYGGETVGLSILMGVNMDLYGPNMNFFQTLATVLVTTMLVIVTAVPLTGAVDQRMRQLRDDDLHHEPTDHHEG